MTEHEIVLARSCARQLAQASEALAPLAGALDAMADTLISLADGRSITADLRARLRLCEEAVEASDFEMVQCACATAVMLFESAMRRGELK